MGRRRTGGGGTSVAVLGPASGVDAELPRALWTRGEDAVSAGLCDFPVSGAFAEDGTEQG